MNCALDFPVAAGVLACAMLSAAMITAAIIFGQATNRAARATALAATEPGGDALASVIASAFEKTWPTEHGARPWAEINRLEQDGYRNVAGAVASHLQRVAANEQY